MYRISILTIMIMVLISCGSEQSETTVPESPVNHYELVFVDSIGVEIGDSTLMLGSISSLSYALDGSIVLLDRAFSRVMVYNAEGEFLRQIGYRGRGPGGLNLPVTMCLTGSGDVLVSQLDAMERFEFQTGMWIAEYNRLGGMPLPFVLQGMPDSTFIGICMDIHEEDESVTVEVILGKYSPGSSDPLVEFASDSFPYDPTNAAFMFEKLFDAYSTAVSEDGRVFIACRSGMEYRIVCCNSEGEVLSEFIRDDIDPLEKSAEAIRMEAECMEARLASMDAAGLDCSPDPYYPMVDYIGLGPGGDLWVRRGHSFTPEFDIYDESFNLTGTASLDVDPTEGREWRISVQPEGVLAYSENPCEGYQKVYILEARNESTTSP